MGDCLVFCVGCIQLIASSKVFYNCFLTRRDRLNTGLTTFSESSGSVKVSKEGRGLLSLWRQHLQQFQNVSAEIANAKIAEYPSPKDLWQVLYCQNIFI